MGTITSSPGGRYRQRSKSIVSTTQKQYRAYPPLTSAPTRDGSKPQIELDTSVHVQRELHSDGTMAYGRTTPSVNLKLDRADLRARRLSSKKTRQVSTTIEILSNINDFSHYYDVEMKIAKGGFGTIYRVKEIVSGTIYASKLTRAVRGEPWNSAGAMAIDQLRREVEIHAGLNHPNIVCIHRCFYSATRDMEGFITVMDYAELGSLRDIICKRREEKKVTEAERKSSESKAQPLFSTEEVQYVLNQLFAGLVYLHEEEQLVHRDLKPENILLTNKPFRGRYGNTAHRGRSWRTDFVEDIRRCRCKERLLEATLQSVRIEDDEESVRSPTGGRTASCLVCEKSRVLLADFGFTRRRDDHLVSFCGSASYVAPEIVMGKFSAQQRDEEDAAREQHREDLSSISASKALGDGTNIVNDGKAVLRHGMARASRSAYDEKCDVWSAGIIAFELLVGEVPFRGRETETVLRRIANGNPFFASNRVSPEAQAFLKFVLQRNPRNRPSISEVLDHPFLKGYL